MKIRFVEDGNFSGWLRTAFIVVGALLIVLPTKFMESSWLWFGLLLCGLVKPFDNSYKKARESYRGEDDKQDERK
jgi:hypothetical protein